MLKKSDAKQLKYFLQLLVCSLVAGVSLAAVISLTFDPKDIFARSHKQSQYTKDIQLRLFNPQYLDFSIRINNRIEAPITKQAPIKSTSISTKKSKVHLIYKARTKTEQTVRKIVSRSATKSSPAIAPQKEIALRQYNLAADTEVSGNLTTSEFLELQEFMTEEKYTYETSDQYIASLNAPKVDSIKDVVPVKLAANAKVKLANKLPTEVVKRSPAQLVATELSAKGLKDAALVKPYTLPAHKGTQVVTDIKNLIQLNEPKQAALTTQTIQSGGQEIQNSKKLKLHPTDPNKRIDFLAVQSKSMQNSKNGNASDKSLESDVKQRAKPAKVAVNTAANTKDEPPLEARLNQILQNMEAESRPNLEPTIQMPEVSSLAAEQTENEVGSKQTVAETVTPAADPTPVVGMLASQNTQQISEPAAPTHSDPSNATIAKVSQPEFPHSEPTLDPGPTLPAKEEAETITAASAAQEFADATSPTMAPASASVRPVSLKGMLIGQWPGVEGHFEVGFYQAINNMGEPVGAPLRTAILPAGKQSFQLRLSNQNKGFLFARFYPKDANDNIKLWHPFGAKIDMEHYDEASMLSLAIRWDRENASPAQIATQLANTSRTTNLEGQLRAMFSDPQSPLWIHGAKIRIRGTSIETTTDENGKFKLSLSASGGRALFEILAPGYLPRVVNVDIGNEPKQTVPTIELASKSAVKHLARSLGLQQSDALSVLIIDTASTTGVRLPGISAQLSLKAEGPFYFNEKGFPARDLLSTTRNGKIIYFNVEPGIGFLETFILGQPVSPTVVSVIEGSELVHQDIHLAPEEITIKGKIFDPIESDNGNPLPVSGARVRIAGSTDWSDTDSFGNFELPMLRYADGGEVLLEVSARGYYNHRFSLRITQNKVNALRSMELFIFPRSYISELAKSVDLNINPNKGMLIGKISLNEKVRIDTLSEHSSVNIARDYYFDENNILKGSYAFTQPRNGLFSIFNISPGRTILHGYNPSGNLRYAGVSYFSPSTINVIVE